MTRKIARPNFICELLEIFKKQCYHNANAKSFAIRKTKMGVLLSLIHILRNYLIKFAVDQTLETIRLSVETGRSERCFNSYIPFRVRQIKRMPPDISAAIFERLLQILRTSNNLGEEASKKLIASI